MTRDVSRRLPSSGSQRQKALPRRHGQYTNRRVGKKRSSHAVKGAGLVACLLAINIGVIAYHGDPRELLPEAAPSSKARTSKSSGASVQTAAVAPEHSAALAIPAGGLTEPDAEPTASPAMLSAPLWTGRTLQPLFGLRTPGPVQRVNSLRLRSGQTVVAALDELGVHSEFHHAVLESLGTQVDFRRLQPGYLFKARFGERDDVLAVEVQRSFIDRVQVARAGDTWTASKVDVPVESVVANVSGRVESSLWEAVARSGEDPKLALDIAEIFAWDIDFYTEVYPKDTFRLLVEKRYVEGKFLDYGRVLAAEFSSGGRVSRAFLFESGGSATYYDEKGQSLRKQLLKSPLKFGHVTSRFGTRRHPVLGYTRAHNGIDYGVPTGTPVWTVGDGRVIKAGWHGGFGKLVEVRHSNGWVSQYAHLSAIHVKVGQRVSQKHIVGKVGTTGMSTGPHLHYGLKKDGRYVNPLAQKFERAEPLRGDDKVRYLDAVSRLTRRLAGIQVAEGASNTGQADDDEAVSTASEG